MAYAVDQITSLFIAKVDGYERDVKRAAAAIDTHTAAIERNNRAEAKADIETSATRKRRTSAEVQAAREQATIQKAAAKEIAAEQRLQAKAAADAVVAAEKSKQAALKETARVAEAAAETERRAAVRSANIDRSQAERKPQLFGFGNPQGTTTAAPGERSGQASIPAGVLNGTPAAASARAIDHEIADRATLQAGLVAATREETALIRDQITQLNLVAQYKRAGLSETEAAIKAEEVLSGIEGRRAEKAAALAAAQTAASEKQVAAQTAALEKQIAAQSAKVSGGISTFTGALVGGVTVHELSALNDEYIRFANSLRVAGVSATEFDDVQKHLLQTATRTGTNIGSLADTYRSIALASHDLGASQQDILTVTDAVANSLKITGASGGAARAAILQLGHAFETGRVTAREFNGLALNAYPILQAAAAGSDKYAGSVAKLRQALLDGDLSSKEFFANILKGADTLQGKAANAALTTAQGFTALNSALTVYIGTADQASGLSAAFGLALQTLAQNLDIVIPAIAAIGTALTVGYITRMALAAKATQGLNASILAAFGGPIGLTITAITLALGAFAAESARVSALYQKIDASAEQLQGQLQATALSATTAGGGIHSVGSDALGAIPKVNAFAGAIGNLAQQLYNQARAARAARVESLQAQLAESRKTEVAAGANTAGARNSDAGKFTRGDFLGNLGELFSRAYGNTVSVLSGGRTDRTAASEYSKAVQNSLLIGKQLHDAQSAPITAADIPGGISSGLSSKNADRLAKLQDQVADLEKLKAKASGRELATINKAITKREKEIGFLEQGVSKEAASAAAAGGGAGRRGPSAETLAKRAEAARLKGIHEDESYNSDLKQAHDKELQARADLSNDAAARADLERQRVHDAADELAKNIRAKGPKDARLNAGVAGTGERDAAETAELLGINSSTADLNVDKINRDERHRQAQDALALDRAQLGHRRDELQSQESLADTAEQRRKLALQILDVEYEIKKRELNAIINPDSGATKSERDIAFSDLGALPDQKKNDEKTINRQNEGAGASYLRGLNNFDGPQFIQSEEVKTLEAFNAGLDDSVKKALHLHGIFGDIVADLIDMAIKQAIIKPIANALFGGGDTGAGGAGGLVAGLIGSIGHILGFAGGGDPPVGRVSIVGERGPELFVPKTAGTIIPNHAISAVPTNIVPSNSRLAAAHGGDTHLHQTINIDGSGVNPAGFAQAIIGQVRGETRALLAQGQRQTLDAVPSTISRYQQQKG